MRQWLYLPEGILAGDERADWLMMRRPRYVPACRNRPVAFSRRVLR